MFSEAFPDQDLFRVPDSAAGKKRAFSEDSEGEAEYIDTQREIIRDNTPASAIFEPDPLLATHRRAKRAKFGVSQATTMSSRPSAAAGPSASRHNDLIIDESLEETPDPENQPLYMSKAHEMKAGLGHLPFLPNAGHRKRMPEHDPENHEIMRLRVEERMGWADIADALNEDRVGQGKVSTNLVSILTSSKSPFFAQLFASSSIQSSIADNIHNSILR